MTVDSLAHIQERVSKIKADLAGRVAKSELNKIRLTEVVSQPSYEFSLDPVRLEKILLAISGNRRNEIVAQIEEPTSAGSFPFTRMLIKSNAV